MTEEKRPSLREAARRGVEAKQQTQAAQPAAATPAAAAPRPAAPSFQKVKPPVVGIEQVTVKCGHVVPFELFDLRKDKFRNDRRKKLTDRDCSACRIKAQEVRQAAEMEEARLRRLERPRKERPQAKPQSRLPHGARFDVAWDAAKGQWSGTLSVPTADDAARCDVFTAAASGVFKLLQVLDGKYRATLPPEEASVEA
jgi:hypothetical protein